MTCHNCRSECRKFGKHRNGLQRYRCAQCRKTFTEAHENTLEGMYISVDKAEQILKMLVEGCSVNTIERLTDVHHTTILKLLVLAGEKCEKVMASGSAM
jgi:transposase-like protein